MFKAANFLISILLFSILSSCGIVNKEEKSSLEPGDRTEQNQDQKDIAESLQTELKQLYQLPAYTIIMAPKGDIQKSIENLLEGGAKLIYDPNNRASSTIPFYIAELTPDQINDKKFIKTLDLKAAEFDSGKEMAQPINMPVGLNEEGPITTDFSKFIPVDSVKLGELGEHKELGKGIVVAVVDTGTEAAHPSYMDRMVYWYDATEQTRTELKKVEISEDSIVITEDGEDKKIALPKALKGETEIYSAMIDESKFVGQFSDDRREKQSFLDLNKNGSADKFLVFVKKDESGDQVYIDLNGDSKFLTKEENSTKIDFNTTTKDTRTSGLAIFPSRNNLIRYPVLLTEEDDRFFIDLGTVKDGSHGTHVAGIIGANDPENGLLGAAPQASLMGIRVCAEGGCSHSAMLKGIVKAFYNGKVVPDVVNMSLGSLQQEKRSIFSILFTDLSAKFGTVFFISASNNGPGFKTLNSLGTDGPVVSVGANVSKKTYKDQYNLPSTSEMPNETLLFFSSLGPSYTGEMKPNIVAPGGSVSTVATSGNYLKQMNGTSMSSPLAAGAFASILGTIKAKDSSLFKEIERVRKLNSEGQVVASNTLLPYVYAMRDSIQNGAVELDNLTTAQQGYGLMQSGATEVLLTQYLKEVNDGERDYFEVVLNNYGKGYSRELAKKQTRKFELSVGFDGERSKKSLAKILSGEVKVVLKQVEMINNQGKVKRYTGDKKTDYFSIIERGNESKKASTATVVFNNGRNSGFVSRRDFSKMHNGNTYIAQYQVLYQGVVMTNILDVVHRPYLLKEREVSVSSIDPNLEKVENAFAKTGLEIETSHYHRYPIAITEDIKNIEVKVAIDREDSGVIYVQLYRPDGTEASFKAAVKTDLFDNNIAHIIVSTGELKDMEKSKTQAGIWELTISTGSSNGAKKTKYDLLIETHRFGTSQMVQKMKAGEVNFIPVQLGGVKIGKVTPLEFVKIEKMEVETKTRHTSFHPLPLGEDFTGSFNIGTSLTDREVYNYIWFTLNSGKFFIKKDGEFVLHNDKENKIKLNKKTGFFEIKKPIGQKLYFSFFTHMNFSNGKYDLGGKLENKIGFEFLTPVEDKKLVEKIKITAENYPNFGVGAIKVDASELEGSDYNLKIKFSSDPGMYSQSMTILFRDEIK